MLNLHHRLCNSAKTLVSGGVSTVLCFLKYYKQWQLKWSRSCWELLLLDTEQHLLLQKLLQHRKERTSEVRGCCLCNHCNAIEHSCCSLHCCMCWCAVTFQRRCTSGYGLGNEAVLILYSSEKSSLSFKFKRWCGCRITSIKRHRGFSEFRQSDSVDRYKVDHGCTALHYVSNFFCPHLHARRRWNIR